MPKITWKCGPREACWTPKSVFTLMICTDPWWPCLLFFIRVIGYGDTRQSLGTAPARESNKRPQCKEFITTKQTFIWVSNPNSPQNFRLRMWFTMVLCWKCTQMCESCQHQDGIACVKPKYNRRLRKERLIYTSLWYDWGLSCAYACNKNFCQGLSKLQLATCVTRTDSGMQKNTYLTHCLH